jgi:hypothetical protein
VTALAVTFFTDEFARTKREQQIALADLVELIRVTSAPQKTQLPWLKLAGFGTLPTGKNSLRWDGNVTAISGIEADYDGERVSFEAAIEILEEAGLEAIVYTSPSHTPDEPRWRVLCPLSTELLPKQRPHLLARLNGLFGGIFSAESWALSQAYYFGSVDHNPAHQVALIEGLPIDRCDELDRIAIGKPHTEAKPGNGLDPGPADEAALLEEIRTGHSYHQPAIRLLGLWVHQGVGLIEAEQRLRAAFDCVFPLDRDQRWQTRVAEIPKLLEYVWGKEAIKPPPPSAPPADFDDRTPPPAEDEEPLRCEHLAPHAISSIPPRQWAYGFFLLFGHAAVIGAADGTGKGALAVVIALSMITGRSLLGERVWRTGPVAIVSYEDDRTEWCRRVAAACLRYELDYATVIQSFYFIDRPGSRICLAAQSIRGAITFPDGDMVIARLTAIGAVLLIIDPFNHAHALEDGNNNALVAKVADEAARIAAESGAVTLVLHHLRKGATGSADDLLGAVSLRATFRSCRILARMTPEEAEKLSLPRPQAWRYSRIAATKENYAPPPDHARWYRLESVDLGNPDGLYTDGDNVQVIGTWTPPSPSKDVSLTDIGDIFAKLRAPPGEGLRWSPDRRAKAEWAGNPIVEITGKNDEEAARIISGWVATSTLIEGEYQHPKQRKLRRYVALSEAKAAEILGPLYFKENNDEDSE